jgi:hypothetical protein
MRDGVCDSGSGARAAFSCSIRTGGGAAGAIFVPNVGSTRKSEAETEGDRRRPGCPDGHGSHGGLLTMQGPHDEGHARRAIGIGARGWAAGVSVPAGTPGHAVRAEDNLRRPEPAVKRASASSCRTCPVREHPPRMFPSGMHGFHRRGGRAAPIASVPLDRIPPHSRSETPTQSHIDRRPFLGIIEGLCLPSHPRQPPRPSRPRGPGRSSGSRTP